MTNYLTHTWEHMTLVVRNIAKFVVNDGKLKNLKNAYLGTCVGVFDIVKFVVKLNNCTDAHKGSHNTDGPYFNHCEVCDN